jgi:polyisoprenoid-binding protein YceI
MRDGKLDPAALSAADKSEIERALREEVLHTDRHPKASFGGQAAATGADRFELSGALELHGKREPLVIAGRREGQRLLADVELRPSRFGIEPYRALGGALKLDDRVVVRTWLPLSEALASLELPALLKVSERWSVGEAL